MFASNIISHFLKNETPVDIFMRDEPGNWHVQCCSPLVTEGLRMLTNSDKSLGPGAKFVSLWLIRRLSYHLSKIKGVGRLPIMLIECETALLGAARRGIRAPW